MKKVTFHFNGIKVDGKLIKCYYWLGAKKDSIKICTKSVLGDLPREIFAVENNTDYMTDYFDHDRVYVSNTHPLFKYVAWAWGQSEIHTYMIRAKALRKKAENPFISERSRNEYIAAAIRHEEAAADIKAGMGDNPGQPTAKDIQEAAVWMYQFAS